MKNSKNTYYIGDLRQALDAEKTFQKTKIQGMNCRERDSHERSVHLTEGYLAHGNSKGEARGRSRNKNNSERGRSTHENNSRRGRSKLEQQKNTIKYETWAP